MENKILSIIVPSYNMEAYLPKCLSSLVIDDKQLLRKLDVIVVNDGSKDRTSEIAHEFEAKYPDVFRVIDKENGHYGSCINAGVKIAAGTYVKVLDADDWFNTNNFQKYLRFLVEQFINPKGVADLVVSDFESVNGDFVSRKSYNWIGDGCSVVDFDYSKGHDLWMHAIAYRTQKLRDIGYEQLTGMTHTDIQWLHLPMITVNRITYFPEVVYEYQYLREGNTSTPAEYYRTYAVQECILKHMIEEYMALKFPINKAQDTYLRNHLCFRAKRAYRVHLVERSGRMDDSTLVDLDGFIKNKLPWLYAATENVTFTTRIHWRYIHAWRKRRAYTVSQRCIRFGIQAVLKVWGMLGGIR